MQLEGNLLCEIRRLDLESNLLFLGGGGVIYYRQLEGNFLCEIRSA